MAKSKNSLGKFHIALENMWVSFKYLLILISNIIPTVIRNRLCMISILLHHELFAPVICPGYVLFSLFTAYVNLNKICIQLLCEICINLNDTEFVHSAFHVYYIPLHFPLVALLILESLIVKFQLKILIYLKSNYNIYWKHM